MQFKHLFLTITFLSNLLLAGFAQEPILLEHGGGVRTVEFSPVDASLVASAGESNLIKLWNLQNDTVMTLRGHTAIVNSIAFSPNGELLASVSDDRTIKLWNVRNQQNIATLREGTLFRTVAFSPDGQILATGGWMHVKLWDVRRRAEIATLQHDRFVQTVTFSHDGQFLAAGDSSRDGSGTVKVWDVQKRQVIATLKDDLVVVRSVTFSSDDRYLASSHYNGEVKVWDVLTWELLHTIPAGDYDIAFSPDGKMIAGTGNGYVNLWWVEDGAKVAQLPGPTDWMHPVDFSHDGGLLAVGAEDGIIRIWRIDTSPVDGRAEGAVQILHIDTYFQQLPKANSANGDNIPDPAPPTAVVREFFELDPYYEQWINVEGLPVIASAKVNPYALKESAWLIKKTIGHLPDVLRAMVKNKARLSVIPYTEVITEIPEYRYVGTPDFVALYIRGGGGSEGATTTVSEENILSYPGETETGGREYSILIHEIAHAIHLLGFNTLDPTFDERLRITYEAAMEKGLWQGTYASSNRREYWAEGTLAWFYPNGSASSFSRFGNTRRALKEYDPELATLLTEVYGDREWRYTPVATRTHLPHLQGFNPQDSPTFEWWPELVALNQQLGDPNSDGDGRWVDLKPYDPSELPRLTKLDPISDLTTIIFVNFTETDVLFYEVYSDGIEHYTNRYVPGQVGGGPIRINQVLLVKDADGRNIAAFQAVEKTGRALIGTPPDKTNLTPQDESVIADLSLEKITGPWLWMIAPTTAGQGGANSTNVDSLAEASNGAVTESDVATKGTVEGDSVGDLVWTLGDISPTGGNNVTDLINKIGLGRGDVNDHSSYAFITLESATVQSDVTMVAGSDDAIKIWLNGEVVHNNPIDREAVDFQDTFKVDLNKGDNLLLVKVGERGGWWSMFVGIDADVNAVYKRPPDPVASVDVNGDGIVNILDLVLISANFGKTGQNPADVNGDGVVNIVDLVKVASEMGAGAAAPSAHPQTLEMLTAADVRWWLTQAEQANLIDATSQRGILMLQQLLAALVPKETSLLPNYPNPFNPETWIPYQLSETAEVTLHIYAVDGTLIRTLALGYQPAGMYQSKNRAVYWDGRNKGGEPVASGVYFYTITAGNFTATRKMLIRK